MAHAPRNQAEDDRRRQKRVPIQLQAVCARRWVEGAWRDLEARVIDLSPRGIGLSLDREVRVGDRVSLQIALNDGGPDLRVTVEIRHVHADAGGGQWRAGGLLRNVPQPDFERVSRFVATAIGSSS